MGADPLIPLFKIGDIFTIENKDGLMPEWCRGKFRIVALYPKRIEVKREV